MTLKISTAQRRARLVARHGLAHGVLSAPAATATAVTVTEAAERVIALHATDPVTVYLSAWARTRCGGPAEVDEALYESRLVVRMLGMRRTMFVVPAQLAPVVQAACTDEIARRLRQNLERDLAKADVPDAARFLRETCEGVVRALTARGTATGTQIAEAEPRLRTQIVYAPDKSYGGAANITSRVLMLLSAEGLIVRGHRRGGWSSGQFTWFPADAWLPAAPPAREPAPARAELARRWLLAFGPAPVSDLRWWAGWTGAQTKAALAALPVREADLDGQPGVLLGDDEAAEETPPPHAALLPALDPTPMGWQRREWFLGPHGPALFDRTGNIGPTVWWQGRIIGGWAQRPSGEVVCRLLEDAGPDGAAAVETEAARLAAWLASSAGTARVTPRFRTPLERELSA
jgi:hypothetical protein